VGDSVDDQEQRRGTEGRRVRGCGGEPQKETNEERSGPGPMTRDERLNASLPAFLLHSTSSPFAVSARARLRPERFGACPP
jgi:hypothetical protein